MMSITLVSNGATVYVDAGAMQIRNERRCSNVNAGKLNGGLRRVDYQQLGVEREQFILVFAEGDRR